MGSNNRNEIIKLLKNIQLSRFLECPSFDLDDLNANIVLSSLYMLLRRDDYPIHFDEMGTGNLYQILFCIGALLFMMRE